MTRRRRYSAEFKREALKRANEEGVTDVLVSEELGINAVSDKEQGNYDSDRTSNFSCGGTLGECELFHIVSSNVDE